MSFIAIMMNETRLRIKGIFIYGICMGLLILFFSAFYDPVLFDEFSELLDSFPAELLIIFGSSYNMSTFDGYMNLELFSLAWVWYGIYFIIKTAQDIPNEIDNKTIDLTLSKPLHRWEFILGKTLTHIIGLTIVMIISWLTTILFLLANPSFKGYYDIGNLSLTFLCLFFFLLAIIASAMLFSTFIESKKALSISFGFIIAMFFLGTYWEYFNENIHFLKYLSLFYYFDSASILNQGVLDNVLRNNLILTVYSIVVTLISILIFNRRDIPV